MINDELFIVNGDDFGFDSPRNHAIIEAFGKEKINSTTLMANMPGFEEAVDLAHLNRLTDKIGTHLVLTEGYPLTEDIRRLEYLFSGSLNKTTKYKKLFFLSMEDKKLIFNEYAAQLEKTRRSHIKITHIDTHLHLHSPWALFQLLIALLKEFNIPSMRIQFNLGQPNKIFLNTYRNFINHYLRSKKMNFSNYLGSQIDFLKAYDERGDFWSRHKVEIMVHPDYTDEGILFDRTGDDKLDFNFISILSEKSGFC